MKTCNRGHTYITTRRQCPECQKAAAATWRAIPENRARQKAAKAAWQAAHPDRHRAAIAAWLSIPGNRERHKALKAAWSADPKNRERQKAAWRKSMYGITPDGLKALLERQGHSCPICLNPVTGRDHVDHDHVTGKVRGVLHRQCNMALGFMKDDPARLRRAMGYVESGSQPARAGSSSPR